MADKPGVATSFPDHSFDNDGNLTTTGSANAYLVKTGRRIMGLYKGLRICARVNFTNSGAATLKVDDAPAAPIRKAGNAALTGGELVSGVYYDFIYDDANAALQVVAVAVVVPSPGITTIASGSFPAAATLSITNIPAIYSYLVFQINGLSINTAGRHPRVQFSTNNGSSYDGTLASYWYLFLEDGNVVAIREEATAILFADEAAASTFSGTLRISCYHGGPNAMFDSIGRQTTAASLSPIASGSYIASTSAINALQVNVAAGGAAGTASGTFDAGTYALYGFA